LTAMDGGWQLELAATQFAQSVHLEFEHHVPDDDWFHLAPGHTRIIRLLPRANAPLSAKPTGTVRHLGSRTGHTIS
jgi:beta-mannosidase